MSLTVITPSLHCLHFSWPGLFSMGAGQLFDRWLNLGLAGVLVIKFRCFGCGVFQY
jgi:hypothetical protein